MHVIRSSWQAEVGRLICRWQEPREFQSYEPPWVRDTSLSAARAERVSPLAEALDFANNLSPLAGRGWFERALEGWFPQRARWL